MIESGDMIESPRPGAPDDGPVTAPADGPQPTLPPPDLVRHRIWRSPDRVLTGAAGGLAAALGVDAVWTRMAFVVLTLFRGVGVWLYVVASLLMPAGPFARPVSVRRRVVAGAAAVGLVLVLWDGLETPYGNRFAVPYGPIGLIGSPSGLVFLLAGAAVVLWRRDQPRPPRPSTPPTGWAEAGAPWPTPAFDSGVTNRRPPTDPDARIEGTVGAVGSPAAARPPRVRRAPSVVGRLAFAVALALVAVVAAMSGGRAHALEVAFGLAAAVCGLGLVAGSRSQRARWLVVPAALALAGSLVASADDFAGTRFGFVGFYNEYGSMLGGPERSVSIPASIEHGAGDVHVYLGGLDASRSLTVRVGTGSVVIWVPTDRDLHVEGTYRVGLGTIELDGGPRDRGYRRSRQWGSGTSSGSIAVRLDASVGIGDIRVIQYRVSDASRGLVPGSGLPPEFNPTTTVFPPVTAPLPEGAVSVDLDGTTYFADGRTQDSNGWVHYPDGTTVSPTGNITLADGTEIHADGSRVYGSGAQVLADGTVVLSNSARILPDGTVVLGEPGGGQTILPWRGVVPTIPATRPPLTAPPLTTTPPLAPTTVAPVGGPAAATAPAPTTTGD